MLRMRLQWFEAFHVSAYFRIVSRQKGKAQNGFQDISIFKGFSNRDPTSSDVKHRKKTISPAAHRCSALPLQYRFVTESENFCLRRQGGCAH